MMRCIATLVLPLALLACTTPEERFASDANQMFAGGNADLPQMCGAVGEIILERSEMLGLTVVQAQVSSASVVEVLEFHTDVMARVKAGASGYLSSLITFDCRFENAVSRTPPWHELVSLKMDGEAFDDGALANVNALGASLAGQFQSDTAQ